MGDELRGESLVHLNVRFSTETELKAIQDMLYEKSGQGVSFTGLVEAMAHEVTIVTAIHNIKSNKGSKTAGVDKVKMDNYLQMPKDELILLIQSCFRKYQPKPARREYIPKKQRKNAAAGNPYGIGQNHTGMCAANHRADMRGEILSAQLRLSPLPGAKARNPGYCQCNQRRV